MKLNNVRIESSKRGRRTGALVALIAGPLLLPGLVHAQSTRQQSELALEEITVTARKFEENLQTTGASVAAFGSQEIQMLRIETADALQNYTPNLVMKKRAGSGAMGLAMKIRGIGVSDIDAVTNDPSVGVYVDGVFQARAFGPQFELFDLERLEVLRGPQGTLFGKNTMGGAVNIITRKPGPDETANFSLTAGSYDRLDVAGSANAVLIDDRLFARISGVSKQRDGYTRNDFNHGQKVGDEDTIAGRAAFRALPTDSLTLDLVMDYSRQRQAPRELFLTGFGAAGFAATAASVAGVNLGDYMVSPSPDASDLRHGSFDGGANAGRFLPPNRGGHGRLADNADFTGGSFVADWAATDHLSLKSITAYRDYDRFISLDVDGTAVQILDQVKSDEGDQFTQEFQLNAELFEGRLNFVTGAFYLREEIDVDNQNPWLSGLGDSTNPLAATARATGTHTVTHLETEAAAVYAHGVFKITDRLGISAGLRYNQEDKSIAIQTGQLQLENVWRFDKSKSSDFSSVQPKLGIDFEATDDLFFYGLAARGYASGGFNGRVNAQLADIENIDEEALYNYEVGMKSTFWDKRARFNLSAFYMDYSDIVVSSFGASPDGTNAVGFFLKNSGDATIKGLEAELEIKPVRELTLRASLGLLEQEFKDFGIGRDGSPVNPDSAHLFDSPETTAGLLAIYDVSLGDAGGLTVVGDASYRGRVYFDNSNTALSSQEGYSLYNLKATYTFPNERLSLTLWGENLGNKVYAVRTLNLLGTPFDFGSTLFGDPRTWGLTLRYQL
jgi:iron complex outermembrane recepter protein